MRYPSNQDIATCGTGWGQLSSCLKHVPIAQIHDSQFVADDTDVVLMPLVA